MTWVDLFVLLLAVLGGVSGWRHGLAVSLLSFVGVLVGALLGVQLAPLVAGGLSAPMVRVMASIAVVVVLVALGEAAGVFLGRLIRDRLTGGRPVQVESALGALVQGVTVVLAAWLVALPLASASFPALTDGIRGSALLGGMDAVVGAAAPSARELPDDLRAMLSSSAMTPGARQRGRINAEVGPPNMTLAGLPAVRTASTGVLKIHGRAFQCMRALEGSGFVVAPNRVATNAHVVAGTADLNVELASSGGTRQLSAQVVLFNPDVDVAILAVPGLGLAPLRMAPSSARPSGDAIELGYPLDGPLTTTPARIRDQIDLSTEDIYKRKTVVRDVYAIRALVVKGNSGGPLIAPDGSIYGMIFGTDPDHPNSGYALTLPQIAPMLQAAPGLTRPVSTGACGAEP
ncbi:MAG TPA: MarP family serine protease, partial [Pseudonocardia sp.]|nr:MarP family serine protease [Pseudonocardia sp.]